MIDAGFDLRKLASNSPESMNKIKIDETHNFTSNDENPTRNVLETVWDIKKDEIVFDFNDLVDEGFKRLITKRSILSISPKIFNRLGLLSLIAIQLKLLFQLIYTEKIQWDQKFPGSIFNK